MTAGRTGGGGPARRAIARWALRLLRREWRQQFLVLALLSTVVAASVTVATVAYNSAGVSEDADLGSAQSRLDADAPDPGDLPALVAAANQRFGSVDAS